MLNLDNGVADSPAHPAPAGHKMDYQDEAKLCTFPLIKSVPFMIDFR
jgi:hypothetical protein